MTIHPNAHLPSNPGPAAYFTGTVWIDMVLPPSGPTKLKAARVTFQPGARTAWHTHPNGQALHVLSGLGIAQRKGEPAQLIRPGDSVWFEPNELHWHGAAPGNMMVHLAIQQPDENGVDAVWLDHVTDGEYTASV
jgi:quercetin dioxygenase-like cupin family protein